MSEEAAPTEPPAEAPAAASPAAAPAEAPVAAAPAEAPVIAPAAEGDAAAVVTPAPAPDAGATSAPGAAAKALAPPPPAPILSTAAADGVAASTPAGEAAMVPGQTSAEGLQLPVKQPLDLKHERLTGTVSKFVPSNSWGFVKSSDDGRGHMFEGELFFRTERIMPEFQGHPLNEGEGVEFDVQADDHGRPHATMLKPVLGRRPYECLGQRHRGYVRRFAERWGFLNAAAFDGDLFVHRDNLLPVPEQLADGQPPLRAGQAVEFDVALDDRGRAVAKQITTRALLRPCDWIGHRLRGYIRSFQGAWGFINTDRFAGDLFMHRDSLLPQCQSAQLAVGTLVEFDVEQDHHRKGARNRLVARHVAVLGAAEGVQPAAYPAVPQGQPMPGSPFPQAGQAPLTMDPYGAGLAGVPPYGYAGMPQAQYPGAPGTPMYYPQGVQPGVDPNQHLAGLYGAPAPQYPYAQPQYPMQQVLPPQPLPPQYGQQPYAPQPQYGQPFPPQPYAVPPPQPQPMPQPQLGQLGSPLAAQPTTYSPIAAVTPDAAAAAAAAAAVSPQAQQQPLSPGAPAGTVPVGAPAQPVGAVPVAGAPDSQSQGLLHITMHDWEPDQPGQLWVTKGTLVNVSYRAAHGWVYAGTVQPGSESGEPATEGWIPQAVVKRVSLCRVFIDWPAEGSGTLGVSKGEIIAVSKEAERGWVYGERIGPRQPDKPSDGWLPKKVLEYLQS